MMKNLSKIFLAACCVCVAMYIGLFIGRTGTQNMIHISSIKHSMEQTPEYKIDINTATAELLADIPGIDLKTAKAIVAYRDKYGRFYKIKELMDVDGMTPYKYEILKEYVTVDD